MVKKGQQQQKKKEAAAPRVAGGAAKGAAGGKAGKSSSKRNAGPHPLFKNRPKKYGIGASLRPKSKVNLYRFVKWPRYIRLQRHKQVLLNRIKVPPAINQFRFGLEKNHAAELLRLLGKYKPESDVQKRQRLREEAKARIEGKQVEKPKTIRLHQGLREVTKLIEQGEAKLVAIAHDVDPIDLVVWLPTLCQKKNVPYVIIKGKARLGQVSGRKTTAVVALTNVNPEDRATLTQLIEVAKRNYNDRATFFRKTWGGLALGVKDTRKKLVRENAAREEAEAQRQLRQNP
jgi:large subunit ribosomal protein L7Ae